MFQIVRMQPGDSPAELGRLGLKIRCREGEFFMEQPCAALSERRCTVYEKRPVRCRLFHCQQLRRVESGDAEEAEAMNLILETRGMVEQVRSLIEQCGLREDGRSLTERFERVMSTHSPAQRACPAGHGSPLPQLMSLSATPSQSSSSPLHFSSSSQPAHGA